MQRPALGMPDDDIGGAGVLEHRRRDVAGEGAARFWMTVLRAEADASARELPRCLSDERRGGTDEKLGGAGLAGVGGPPHRLDFDQRPGKSVHFPVASDQGADVGGHAGLQARTAGCYQTPKAYAKPKPGVRRRLSTEPRMERPATPNARIHAQCGSGGRRQGDHDRGHGAHHRQLRHLGRRRHVARLHRFDRCFCRQREDFLAAVPRRLPADAAAISAAVAPAADQRAGACRGPRSQRPAEDAERSGARRRDAQARAQHFRRRPAQHDRVRTPTSATSPAPSTPSASPGPCKTTT